MPTFLADQMFMTRATQPAASNSGISQLVREDDMSANDLMSGSRHAATFLHLPQGTQQRVVDGKMLRKARSRQYRCHSLLSLATEDSKHATPNNVTIRVAGWRCEVAIDSGECFKPQGLTFVSF